jgi:hypothetical protein
MKTFKTLREATKKKMPSGENVFSKRVGKVNVMVHKDNKGFTAYIDGEKLDTYRNKREAEKMGIQFAKEM